MKKLICFSLWGTEDKYTIGAVKNAEIALQVYPGWICRYYIGTSTPPEIISSLIEKENTEVFVMNTPGDWTSMFWRFLPASDSDVKCMISRDTDSRLDMREKTAVDEWLASRKSFHIMRDHPYHATEILGGMWGAIGGKVPTMRSMVSDYTKGDFWQVDQNFLKQKVYPLVKEDSHVNDPFFQGIPFPTDRDPEMFVGQAFNADDTPCEPSHAKLLGDIK